MKEAEETFKRFLADQGLRYTRERRLILEEVMARHHHFEPYDLFTRIRQKGEKVSPASVYRTLPLLIQSGIVVKNPCDQMSARHEHVMGHGHHDHLICLVCGKIIEFRSEGIRKQMAQVARSHRFRMENHRMVISGQCRACRTASGNA
jgi:Fur family transcriptional regulator, ferric uptake regulator